MLGTYVGLLLLKFKLPVAVVRHPDFGEMNTPEIEIFGCKVVDFFLTVSVTSSAFKSRVDF